jgi:hypothetical protein
MENLPRCAFLKYLLKGSFFACVAVIEAFLAGRKRLECLLFIAINVQPSMGVIRVYCGHLDLVVPVSKKCLPLEKSKA